MAASRAAWSEPASRRAPRRRRRNTATGWANMYDGFQNAALATPLGIPMIYGMDAVHGDDNVYGATIFPHNIGLGATRDPGPGAADRPRRRRRRSARSASTGTSRRAVRVARNDRWGRTYESFGEDPALRLVDDDDGHGRAGLVALRPGLDPGHREALRRRRRHHGRRRSGQHPAHRGRTAGDPPAAVPGGGPARRRLR